MTTIRRLDENTKAQALRFINTWNADDAYRRFGSAGIGGQDWLAVQLAVHRRPALVAVDETRVVGLLDHVYVNGATHIGIVVDAQFRKRSIGTVLIETLLESAQTAGPVIADCDNDNLPARALLRKCGFTPFAAIHIKPFGNEDQSCCISALGRSIVALESVTLGGT